MLLYIAYLAVEIFVVLPARLYSLIKILHVFFYNSIKIDKYCSSSLFILKKKGCLLS